MNVSQGVFRCALDYFHASRPSLSDQRKKSGSDGVVALPEGVWRGGDTRQMEVSVCLSVFSIISTYLVLSFPSLPISSPLSVFSLSAVHASSLIS